MVLVRAVKGYIAHQSASQAGSVAFSWVLAMFPLLAMVSAGAAYVGEPGTMAALVSRVLDYVPRVVGETLRPAIDQVLGERNRAMLALGFLGTVWASSSGMQAVRTALNRAYGVRQGLSFWRARIKVTLFTLAFSTVVFAAFASVVVMPYLLEVAQKVSSGEVATARWLQTGVRYGTAWLALGLAYTALYGWLPDIRQSVRTVVPGALFGATLWIAIAFLLVHSLRRASNLVILYGGLAGMVATLIFLYLSAATLIFGAEFNSALRHDGVPDAAGS
jgi:membrane protein